MRIIVYSETTAATVGGNLGLPEYSYYFILKKYLPVLNKLGEVCYVQDPQHEVDPLFLEAAASGMPSVFLSFTPPHRTAKNLKCPMVCVLAWEFDNIPSDDWDAQEPWQRLLRRPAGRLVRRHLLVVLVRRVRGLPLGDVHHVVEGDGLCLDRRHRLRTPHPPSHARSVAHPSTLEALHTLTAPILSNS